MAGEDQYINPIIQAMLHTANIQADARSLAEKTRQSKAEEAFRQSQLQQQEGQFEKDLELRHRQADLYGQQIKSLLEHQHIENIKDLHGLGVAGVNIGAAMGQAGIGGETPQGSFAPQPQIPTITNPSASSDKVNIPGVGNVNPAAFGSPAQQAEIVFNQARAEAAGTQSIIGPEKEKHDQADFLRGVTLHNIDSARNQEVERMRAENNIIVAQIHAAATRAALTAQADPEAIANAYKGIFDGQTSYSALPRELKAGVNLLAGQRGSSLPTNQKQYSDRLDTVSGIEDLITQYKDLAINYSRDSKDSNLLYRLPLLNGTKIPYTDLKSKADQLKATGGSLASFFDKQNRKSDAEILRQFDGLFDPKSTMQQNLDKIEGHVKLVNTHLKGIFSGINPEDISMILSNRGLSQLNPNAADVAPVKNNDPLGIR